MNTIRRDIKVPIKTTEQYVTLMTGILRLTGKQLTDTEIQILSTFIDVEKEIQQKGLPFNTFSTEMKKEVSRRLMRDDFNTLNNYIKSFHDKGIIKKTDEGYEILPILIPGTEGGVCFMFKR